MSAAKFHRYLLVAAFAATLAPAASLAPPAAWAQAGTAARPDARPTKPAAPLQLPRGAPPDWSVQQRGPQRGDHWLLRVWHFLTGLFQVPPGQPLYRDPFNADDPQHPWRAPPTRP